MTYTLPKLGLSASEVIGRVKAHRAGDPVFARGQMTAYCMMGSHELQAVLEEAYRVYFFQNALLRRFLPGLRQMEDQLRDIAASLLSGGKPDVRVNLTSGGSESLFCGFH